MKSIKLMLAGASLLLCCGCGMQVKESTTVTAIQAVRSSLLKLKRPVTISLPDFLQTQRSAVSYVCSVS